MTYAQIQAEREQQIDIAHGLEDALNMMNDDIYEVRYDVCESCLTEIFESGKCIHIIKNDELVPSFNITDLLDGKMDIR